MPKHFCQNRGCVNKVGKRNPYCLDCQKQIIETSKKSFDLEKYHPHPNDTPDIIHGENKRSAKEIKIKTTNKK